MPDEENLDQQAPEVTEQLESQAREMGWRPKEEFKGAEDKWVDAKTFVERGEHVLPIVKATNARLRDDLAAANARTAQLEAAVADTRKAMEALEKYHAEDVKQKVERARADLRTQLIEAKKSGDVETEVLLTEKLADLRDAEDAAATRDAEATGTKATPPPPKDYTKEPDFVSWRQDNEWFGQDRARTAIAYDVTSRLRAAGDTTVGRAFLDKVTTEVNKEVLRLAGGRPTPARVEGGKGGAGGNSGGSRPKSFDDLPADAKKACDDFARDLVGPNKRYKDQNEWRKAYATQYFAEV